MHRLFALSIAFASSTLAQTTFTHFEARQTHPIALTLDGSKVLAVNSPDARLSVFDATTMSLTAEVPVGLEPVSVRARTNAEAWVVNEVSDTVTIVSLTSSSVIATLKVSDEPADVVFANGKAFVSCARAGVIRVFDASTRADLGSITLTGDYPRALCASADGTKVYAAFQQSGNRTTVLPASQAPDQPAPTNPNLPAPPKTALIVDASDPRIHYTVLDNDVAEINTTTQTVTRYLSDVGTNLFDVALRPGTDEVWVPNTEALNRTRFEPVLNGHFADNRVTRIALTTPTVMPFDLNPGVDYNTLPNVPAKATSLAQPMGMVFSSDGATGWVAAFASDRVAKFDPATGSVVSRVDVRTSGDTKNMRGPRGLALDEVGGRLFVLNKFSNTISVINTNTLAVTSEVPAGSHDPTPIEIKEGRGFLFDARLSGNGTMSCGTCHIDADRDGLAWDLGNPGGDMATALAINAVIHDTKTRTRTMHPMKGPMVTQTLRDLQNSTPFHWRGDKPTLQSFNGTFENLMGGELQVSEDMDLLAGYLFSLVLHPNPNRTLERSLPTTFNGASPATGRDLFNQHLNHCALCHELPRGSNSNIDLPQEVGRVQPIKNPSLRTVYQKQKFDPQTGHTSVSGFGMLSDGTGFALPTVHPYVLDALTTPADFANVTAFMMCFDTGIGLIVGYGPTVNASNKNDAGVLADIALLEARAAANETNVIVRGIVGGQQRSLLWTGTNYKFDKALSGSVTRTALLALITGADSVSFMGVLPGMGEVMSIDHDGDGVLDGDEVAGSPTIVRHPQDAGSVTGGRATFTVEATGSGLHYQWKRGTTNVGTDSATLTVNPAVAGTYSVVVSNTQGSATSKSATLTVVAAPAITTHPATQIVAPNSVATLSVTATGSGLTYQWLKNGNALIGATTSSLVMNTVNTSDNGQYAVIVSNAAGKVTSNAAVLTVPIAPEVNPLNLPDARVGENYSHQITAKNNPTSFTITNLPPGLTYNTTSGLITGHPTAPGQAIVKVKATNAAGPSVEVSDTMEVFDLAAGTVGIYQGVVARQTAQNGDLGGTIKVDTKGNGTFRGTLTLGLKSHPFSGTLSPSGVTVDSTATATVTRAGLPALTVNFTVTPNIRALNGSVSDGVATATFTARQVSTALASYAGNYTFAMLVKTADRTNDAIPQGHSIGAFKVTTAGVATGVIKLCDGTVVTFSNTIEADGSMSLFKLLYLNTGSLLGTLNVDSTNGFVMGSSQLSWFKKTQATNSTTRSYKAGFTSFDLETHGGRYTIPATGVIPLGLSAGANNAKATFFGGAAPSPATRLNLSTIELVAGTTSIAKMLAPNPGIVTLTLTNGSGTIFTAGTTGSFTGTFMLLDPDTTVQPNKPITRSGTITGMIVNDGINTKGYGFYQLPELPALLPVKTMISTSRLMSGSVTLEAAP
ncbi:MAG: immunoglobulin domain-containing protein [Verrucomicrobiaceae bacterium]|nr:immunoglobulin domain-containing protein [Verrucomicrobiaceae bacterium]